MDFILAKIKRYYPILILLLIEFLLFSANFTSRTYFLGWDNLFPEANFPINFQRSIFAIWQEYRGLGLLDGMSYAANLPHYIFLHLLSFFLPHNLLRYVFIFLMHFLGGVGIYFLVSGLLAKLSYYKIASCFGSLFYLLNIATVQMFFASYELFTVHFAALPWLIYFVLRYLHSGRKKDFILLGITSFLSIPQAHVPTLFLVYFIALFTVLGFRLFAFKKPGIKKVLLVLILTLVVNSFWALPYIYSTFHNAQTIINSKINQMSTEDIYLKNKAYGDLKNIILLKGFSLDFVDAQTQGSNTYMMLPWREQMEKLPFVFIGFVFFTLAFLGLIKVILKREKEFYPFLVLFSFSFLMLGTDIPILGSISSFFNNYIPYFFQIFRFTFTKFSILYVFSFAILFSYGISILFRWIREKKYLSEIGTVCLLLMFVFYSFPSFQGHFLYKNLRVNVPKEYFETFKYFKEQDKNTRIASLPQSSFWGWTYNQWGYRGSGFLWYGIPQPVLDGAFYPWSSENENYFWELINAIYSTNPLLFNQILQTHQINWLLVDESIIETSNQRALYLDKLDEIINKSENIKLKEVFGKIKIYKVNLNNQPKDFVLLANDLPVVGPGYKWGNFDKAYEEYGNYISKNKEQRTKNKEQITINNYDAFYPFLSLFTGRKQEELEFGVTAESDYFSFLAKIPKELAGYKLVVPTINEKEVTELDASDLDKKTVKTPQILLDGEFVPFATNSANTVDLKYIKEGNVEVRVPKINGYYSAMLEPITSNLVPKSCDQFNKGVYKHDRIKEGNIELLRLTSIGSSNCLDFDLPNLSQDIGYLVTVENRNVEGKSLLFSVINKNSQRADIETYLPKANEPKEVQPPGRLNLPRTSYFVIPPMEQYGLGYTIHLDNISIGRMKTVNDLGKITVNPIPYRFLTSLKIVKDVNYQPSTTNFQPFSVDHPNPSLYQVVLDSSTIGGVHPATPEVSLPQSSNTTLVLSQSYDEGWKAYRIFNFQFSIFNFLNKIFPFWTGQELKDHVLVNNWENGWNLSNNRQQNTDNSKETIILVYLPQYLEYIGFILFGVGILIVVYYPQNNSNLTTKENSVIARNEITKQSL